MANESANYDRRVATAELQSSHSSQSRETNMHQIIYIVGLIVVVLAILSFFGLR